MRFHLEAVRGGKLLGLVLWSVAALAGPADQAVARWTLLEGGRVGIGGRVITDVTELPAGDYQVEMVDWVAVNAVPEDLERMTGLRGLRELRLPGPLWNRNADGGKDLSKLLKFLAPVTTVEKLTFSDHFLDRIRFRDAGLEEIASLTGLRELAMRQAEVKGPGLRHFANLQSLDVTLCPLADFRSLAGMKGLRRLWAGDTFVTDLAPLAGLTALEDLDLHGTGIRDEGIAYLAGLKGLRRLDLQGTNITDAAVETLEKLGQLESLNLYRTKISNAGLARLRKLVKLRDIDVRYTRVTASGYDALRAALPRARIQFAGGGGRTISKAVPPAGNDARALAEWVRAIGGTARLADGFVSLRGVPLQESAVAALTRIPGLRVLDLEATDVGDAAMAPLATIAGLEELTLNSTQVSDAGLAALGALRSLKKLRLDNTYVEGAAFAGWPAGMALEELSVLGAPVGDGAMAGVARFSKLRRLNLAESDVTGAGLGKLVGLALEELDLSAADVGDDAPLEKFSGLRRLGLRDARISDLMLARKLGGMKNLRHLDLARTRISNAGIAYLAGLSGLVSLDLSYAELDDEGLAKITGLGELVSLNLDSTHVTDAAVELLGRFSKLRQVDLYHSLVTAAGEAKLRARGMQVIWDKEAGDAAQEAGVKYLLLLAGLAMPGQTALDLSASWTTDGDLDRVAERKTLEKLSLAQTRVTDAGLERLRDLNGLRELDLYFAEFFTDDGIAALRGLGKLERLNLRGTKVTSRSFEPLSHLTALRSLDISYSQIDDAGVELLAELPQLEKLAMGGTRIGVVALAALKLLPGLKDLDLSGMQRVDSGHWGLTLSAAVLGELGTLENLESLNLSGAVLNDIGADKPGLKEEQRKSLDGLEKLSGLGKLVRLDLSRTPVNTAGLRALKGLANLRELRLALAKNIDDEAIEVLAGWRSLRVVSLEGTRVTAEGVARLRAARPELRLLGPS